jgi:pimeloyl-ACP methyl ester carboxylesterase
VLLLHGSGGDRAQVLPEAKILASEGFGVLALDWPGHGESAGEVRWADGERAAVAAAVDWLAARRERIGAYGFSMGGYVLAQVAATDRRIEAVALAGTPSSVLRQSRWQWERWSVVSQWPARLALDRGGLRLSDPQPGEVVAALSPRPLLVIGATRDFLVPSFMAHELHDAAGAPRELYLVDAAIHGGYHAVAPTEYAARLAGFYRRALVAQGNGTGAAK